MTPICREFPSDLAEVRAIQDEVEGLLQSHRFGEKEIYKIRLSLEEALVNAVKHGNQMDSAKKVRVCWEVAEDRFEVTVTDEGPGFDPDVVPDPTAPENLERACGRGLFLIKHYMDEVSFRDSGNTIAMKLTRNGHVAAE